MQPDEPMAIPQGMATPAPAHPGEPQVTAEDPSADGYYCAAQRSHKQVAADQERGQDPWPYCRQRAGFGTDHVGVGRCVRHAGATPNHRAANRLRLAELAGPAMALLARMVTDETAPPSVRTRAAQDLLDRAGYPRRIEVDVDDAKESIVERLVALQQSDEATS